MVGGVALLVFGGVLGLRVHHTGLAHLDEVLRSETSNFFEVLQDRREPMNWDDDDQVRQLFGLIGSLYVFQVEQPPGKIVFRSRNLGPTRSFPVVQDSVPFTTDFADHQLRVYQTTQDGIRISIAANLGPIEHVERTLWTSYAILLPVTLLLIAIGGSWLSRKALSPVEEIAAAAERITAERSGQRLPSPHTNDEIRHLTDVLNAMIERIQQSYEQARRFSADASHELKTPLTIIRGEIEAALRSSNLPPAQERVMLNLQEETERLVHIVEGLLLLSQADAGKLKLDLRPVNFSEMLEDLMEDVEILAAPRDIRLRLNFAKDVIVRAEPQFLRQILLNLFDNAMKYNEPNGEIRAELQASAHQVVFRIANTGPAIGEDDRARIFDRFHRAERSRERSRGGQGLGLSICREIARAHGGEIDLVPCEPGWNCFELKLPGAPALTVPVASASEASGRA
jgi:signal transduction histidine kinase